MKRAKKFIEQTLQIEGKSFSDNKNDKGGATKYGITEATARANGYMGDMKDLPLELAYEIYAKEYYFSKHIDKITNDEIAFELFDSGVNFGTETAVKLAQRAFNTLNFNQKYGKDLEVDGDLGPLSIATINGFKDGERLFLMMNMVQASGYINIAERDATQREWVWGWINQRVLNQIA